MPKLIAYEFYSLDGMFEGPEGHEMDFVTDGFTPEIEEHIASQYAEIDAFVMGSVTHRKLAGYWPTPAAREERLVDDMNRIRKLVVGTSADPDIWPNSDAIAGNAIDGLNAALLAANKDFMIIGSGSLVRSLADAGLIDEFRLLTFPIVLRAGTPLFGSSGPPLHLSEIASTPFGGGVVERRYRRLVVDDKRE